MGGDPRDAKRLDDLDPEDDETYEGHESGTIARDTVRPAFDVERYAEDTIGRERFPTVTDEAATEEARIASVLMDSTPPGGRDSAPEIHVSVGQPLPAAIDEEEQLSFLRARLAPMTRVPVLTRPITELGHLIEDPKTAYILGFVDGLLPLETVVDVAGLPELDALRILYRAIEQYVITFRTTLDFDRES